MKIMEIEIVEKKREVRPEDRLTMSRANRYYVAEDHGW